MEFVDLCPQCWAEHPHALLTDQAPAPSQVMHEQCEVGCSPSVWLPALSSPACPGASSACLCSEMCAALLLPCVLSQVSLLSSSTLQSASIPDALCYKDGDCPAGQAVVAGNGKEGGPPSELFLVEAGFFRDIGLVCNPRDL